jgi:hypothetical protein
MTTHGLYAGDFLLSINILLSGNNYRKISLLFKFLNLGIVNRSTHTMIGTKYSAPVITSFWNNLQAKILENYQGKGVVVMGDGRNDSPGFCAQFCTYTFMEYESKNILSTVVIDKRETARKSPNMEREGFRRVMKELQEKGIRVCEVVTDAHPSITKLMRDEHKDIVHQYDMWHGSKNLGKKLVKAASPKANNQLMRWIPDLINHFWHCAEKCEGKEEQLQKRWVGALNHTRNRHEWAGGWCDHDPIDEVERSRKRELGGKNAPPDWLDQDSPPHEALRQVVLDKRLLKSMPFYRHYRHTGIIESFHNMILMYAAKRFAFTPPMYTARSLLAAIDYTMHKDVEVAVKSATGPGFTFLAVAYDNIPNYC